MSKSLLSRSPVFIPKPQDSDIAELGLVFPAILMDSHHIEWRPEVAKKMRGASELFIVNPVTHYLLYKDAREIKSFKKLPYPEKVEAEKLYSDASFRTENVVKKCIDDQVKKGASVIIAPFLFAEDTDDTKFGLNISMLSETIRYVREQKISKPIFAMIHIGNSVMTRPLVINYITDMYTEGFDNEVHGYFLVVNELDDRKADEASLRGLAHLTFQLSKDKDVFIKRVGGFGEILSAIGAIGFSSGLGMGETSSVKNLQKRPKGFGRSTDWVYIPELLDYANYEEIKKIGYKCKCPACKGSIARDASSKKRHFLYRRMEAMEELSRLNSVKRIAFMQNRLENAAQFANKCISKYGSPFKTTHLANWRNVLDAAKSWAHEEKDDKLDDLLSDLESKAK